MTTTKKKPAPLKGREAEAVLESQLLAELNARVARLEEKLDVVMALAVPASRGTLTRAIREEEAALGPNSGASQREREAVEARIAALRPALQQIERAIYTERDEQRRAAEEKRRAMEDAERKARLPAGDERAMRAVAALDYHERGKSAPTKAAEDLVLWRTVGRLFDGGDFGKVSPVLIFGGMRYSGEQSPLRDPYNLTAEQLELGLDNWTARAEPWFVAKKLLVAVLGESDVDAIFAETPGDGDARIVVHDGKDLRWGTLRRPPAFPRDADPRYPVEVK